MYVHIHVPWYTCTMVHVYHWYDGHTTTRTHESATVAGGGGGEEEEGGLKAGDGALQAGRGCLEGGVSDDHYPRATQPIVRCVLLECDRDCLVSAG
jgi:hypothetical protein